MHTNIYLLCILVMLIIILLLINQKEQYSNINVNDITEEICRQWYINKLTPINNKIKNPIPKGRLISINTKSGSNYSIIDKECERYIKLNIKYNSNNVPPYLKVLYSLRNNIRRHNVDIDYNRNVQFGKWISSKYNDCNTRNKVLFRDNKGVITFTPSKCELYGDCTQDDKKCSIYTGKWYPDTGDYIGNNDEYVYAQMLQVDHTVPLKNAWYNGAYSWTQEQRINYANDLTPDHLTTMVYYLNKEKNDSDISEWLPPKNRLKYVSNWISVKYRYNLMMTPKEFNKCQDILEYYEDFSPDIPILPEESIGSALLQSNRLYNYFDPTFKKERTNILREFNRSFLRGRTTLRNLADRNIESDINNILPAFKGYLKQYNRHAYFGILIPEYVDNIVYKDNIFKYFIENQ